MPLQPLWQQQNRKHERSEERPEERLARRRLEPYVGPLEPTDVPGTTGLADYRIIGPGAPGHVEVTSRPDKRRKKQRAALRQRPAFTVPTPGEWTLYLHRNVHTRALSEAPQLLNVLEARKEGGSTRHDRQLPARDS